MNKANLLKRVSELSGLTKKDSEVAIEATIETIKETLAKGEDVTVVGFGSFVAVKKPARTALVPGTDKKVEVPARVAPKFKAGKQFKDALN